MWPIICSPPAASTRGARLEGPGPSRSRLGTHRGERRPSGGETSSWCEAMVRTQPATPQPQKCARRGQRTRSLSSCPAPAQHGSLTPRQCLACVSGPDSRGVEPSVGEEEPSEPSL